MTAFAIEIEDPVQAEALFAFLKTLDSVRISKISNFGKENHLTEEMKNELTRRKNSIGKVKTHKASEAVSYARKKIKSLRSLR